MVLYKVEFCVKWDLLCTKRDKTRHYSIILNGVFKKCITCCFGEEENLGHVSQRLFHFNAQFFSLDCVTTQHTNTIFYEQGFSCGTYGFSVEEKYFTQKTNYSDSKLQSCPFAFDTMQQSCLRDSAKVSR